jgi:hypothetical protein
MDDHSLMKPCQTYRKKGTQERERKGNKGQGLKSKQSNSPTKGATRRKRNHKKPNTPPIA